MHQKYGMIKIGKIMHLIGTNNFSYLDLPIMFYWIDKEMNGNDEVCEWVHQKYGMSWIIKIKYLVGGGYTSLIFLLPIIINWIDKTMNDSDEVWRWVHWKYGMSQIIWKLHSIKKLILVFW